MPLIIAVFLYYIFLPLFEMIEKRTHKKNLAVLVTFIMIIVIVLAIVSFLIPRLIAASVGFAYQIPVIIEKLVDAVDQSALDNVLEPFLDRVDFGQISSMIFNFFTGATASVTNVISIISHSAVTLFTVPLLVFYMYKQGDALPNVLANVFLKRYKDLVLDLCQDFNISASAYVSGQLLVCLYVGILSTILFMVMGLPNALLLGVICGVMDLIPYFGPFLGAAPAFFVALSMDFNLALLLVIFITIIQFGESYLVSPLVMKSVMHIHPIIVVFLLLAAGNLMGILGMIIALPVFAIIRAMGKTVWQFYRSNKKSVIESTNREIK